MSFLHVCLSRYGLVQGIWSDALVRQPVVPPIDLPQSVKSDCRLRTMLGHGGERCVSHTKMYHGTETSGSSRGEGVMEGHGSYKGICAGPDGKLYCAPLNASRVLVIDPVSGTLAFLDGAGEGDGGGGFFFWVFPSLHGCDNKVCASKQMHDLW